MSFPQLRIRTGYSYRTAYGRTAQVIERLNAIGSDFGAMVDWGTWGHVRWEKEAAKTSFSVGFGMEVPIVCDWDEDEAAKTRAKPVAWVLATDTRLFYNGASTVVQTRGVTPSDFGELRGVLRFPGGAIDVLDPSEFDFVDVNPASVLAAHRAVKVAREFDKPMVITAYNDMPKSDDADNAYSWEVRDSVGMRSLEDAETVWGVLRLVMSREEFDEAIANTRSVADSLRGIKLAKAPIIKLDGDMVALAREGQAYRLGRKHIPEWTDEYEERFVEEIKQIQLKDFDSYFLVVADLVAYAKKHMLVGPARGSSSGSLVCYLLGITEVDPILHKLLFQRFIDISRSDLPDIDIDFNDTKRFMVFDYLKAKYGAANVGKLGNINTLQAASVIAQVGKKFGIHIDECQQVRNSLIEYSSADERYGKGLEDTFRLTEPGKEFRHRHKAAAACMSDIEIHPSHSGVHAAGIIVCNDPISDFCTVTEEGVAQLDKPDSEYLNLLKIDALGLRTLGVIESAGVLTNQQLYDLPLDDQAVFDILNEDKISGIFQFEGQAVRSVSHLVDIRSFKFIDQITALARPGPLSSGMATKYTDRVSGKAPVVFVDKHLEPFLADTYGVFIYQEQIMNVVKEIGRFDWVKTSAIRKAMSGRKGEEYFNKMGADFVEGALITGVPEDSAKKIWQEMVTFGAWGFNRSHAVAYAVVTYWTCYLKRYFPLEFAAAALRAAKDDQQTIAILRELAREGISYTPIDPDYSDLNWKVADGRLIGGIMNAKGYGPAKAAKYIMQRTDGTLTDKDRARLAAAEVNYADLNEAHTLWGHFYERPRLCGVVSGDPIVGLNDVGPRKEGLMIVKLTKKILSDENEAIRVKKRGGKMFPGQSQFLDLMAIDDSTNTPFRLRIRPDKFDALGKPIAEGAPTGSWFLVRGWKISGLEMFMVKNIKRLDIEK